MSEPGDRPDEPPRGGGGQERLLRLGRIAWAVVGIALVLWGLGYLAGLLKLVLVPFVLALFPATLLVPVAGWLKDHGVPEALAAIGTVVGGILVIAAVIGLMVPLVQAELPGLTASAAEGIDEIERFLDEGPLPVDVDGLSGLLERAAEQMGGDGEGEGGAAEALRSAFEGLAGFVLVLVALFFYLKEGMRLARGVLSTFPERARPVVRRLAIRTWDTVGPYFRGQLLVALVDAVFIGIGLALLRVPLALPLAVLIFFGGLFPIVGAVTTGVLAVLVALADGGLGQGLIVAGLVLAVQQLESNVLEPLILGRILEFLHPVVIIAAITAGSVLFGILGAFLAVPIAAVVARTVEDERGGGATVRT